MTGAATSSRVSGTTGLVAWRRNLPPGETVALVTGTFDFFQPGNLLAIREARRVTPQVAVLVETPAAAATHCSAPRPQNALETRAEMVACLRDAAIVSGFSPEEGEALLKALQPYVWVSARTSRPGFGEAWLLDHASRRVEVATLPGCASEEVIEAIEKHRTPIAVPPVGLAGGGTDLSRSRAATRVTVNGCFDILHIGHLRFLEQARSLGDSLTVLINSDASVSRYKGPTRPVFPQGQRETALRALRAVDDVVVFDADDPLDAIRELRPTLHVKGGSFEPDRVRQERDLVERHGGRLVCMPLVEGFSTTEFIRRALTVIPGNSAP